MRDKTERGGGGKEGREEGGGRGGEGKEGVCKKQRGAQTHH